MKKNIIVYYQRKESEKTPKLPYLFAEEVDYNQNVFRRAKAIGHICRSVKAKYKNEDISIELIETKFD